MTKLTKKATEKLEWLKANLATIPTCPSPISGRTYYLTGINTSILRSLRDAGMIEGDLFTGGKVINLKVIS